MDILPKSIKSPIPIWTTLILGLSIISYASPQISSALIYDRAAIFQGEIWRLITSHLVHFTPLHLINNLIAFGIAGWIIENRGYQHFVPLCLLMAFFITVSLIVMKPNMIYYGGLSGLASGSIYYLALLGLRESPPWRLVCIVTLFFIPIKIVLEIEINQSIFAYSQPFTIMPHSHIIGCLVALILFLVYSDTANS
ncbi:MAG: rhombosortase [Candidatus Parabeggiatoa sp. nov. 3]|nr:MAG: rhombosortase [Gammaproteobacteria bacterium]